MRNDRNTYDSVEAINETPSMVDVADCKMGAPTAYRAFRMRSSDDKPSPLSAWLIVSRVKHSVEFPEVD